MKWGSHNDYAIVEFPRGKKELVLVFLIICIVLGIMGSVNKLV